MRAQLLMLAVTVSVVACAATEPQRTMGTELPEAARVAQRAELEPKVEDFLSQIAAPGNEEGLARWNQGICPQVTGLSRDEGEFILGRISEIGRAAGAPLAEERCRPNLYIFVTTQPKELLRGMKQRNFAFAFGNVAPAVVDEFIDAPRPVRVWYNTRSETVGGLGQMAQDLLVTAPVVSRVFVIVDRAQVQGVSVGQLADYLAVVGLAQVQPAAQVAETQSILTLFDRSSQPTPPTRMTDWDRAFLKSLYATEQTGNQRAEIASSMVREIVPDPLDEVTVHARRESLNKLHEEIGKTEEAFYKAYNKANTEPDYVINCRDDRAGMSNVRVCNPRFVDAANEAETQGFFSGVAALPAWVVVAARRPAYQKHMLDVVQKNPELIAAARKYYELSKHYDAVRKEKFKGRWLVWD
jgi:hypothetical protein